MPRRLALPCLALAACFQGEALRGEPCARDSDCGPRLACLEDGLCDELRCPSGETITLPTFAPDVVLLVDHAIESVMNKGRGHWSLTRALVEQLGAALGAQLPLGLQVVPTAVADSSDPCVARREAQLLPAPDNAAAIADALPLTAATVGEHALRNGLALVVQAFAAVDPTNLRPQAVVLISDGPFNCAEVRTDLEDRVFKFDTELVPAVAAVAAAGTPVFVVGVDVRPTGGIEPTPDATIVEVDPHLAFNALAEAGGRARPGPVRYFRHTDIDALVAELAALPPAFADCRVQLAARPPYEERMVVEIDGVRLRVEPDCSGGHGWRYVDPASPDDPDDPTKFRRIELCAATCDAFRAARSLTIEHRCPEA